MYPSRRVSGSGGPSGADHGQNAAPERLGEGAPGVDDFGEVVGEVGGQIGGVHTGVGQMLGNGAIVLTQTSFAKWVTRMPYRT